MNETIRCLIERRSVRAYTDRKVEKEVLDEILRAGEFAPTGMGAQSPVMVVVEDEETVALLRKLNAEIMGTDKDPFYGAKTVIVVLADPARHTCVEDGSLVMGNLMNAAFALGVDSCWIHRARETFARPEGKALLKKWGLDENLIGIGNCILGYRSGELPAPKPRKQNYIVRV